MKKRKRFFIGLVLVLLIGFLIPQDLEIPVQGATSSDYNSKSFWFYPWGRSVTHKGVDIFAKNETPINAATSGVVVYAGEIEMGGNIVLVLGPKWRLHYYAHLNELNTSSLSFVTKKSMIGTVGTSGNASGKSPHLHYSICTMIPYVWRIDSEKQGWKKMFYLNPIEYFKK